MSAGNRADDAESEKVELDERSLYRDLDRAIEFAEQHGSDTSPIERLVEERLTRQNIMLRRAALSQELRAGDLPDHIEDVYRSEVSDIDDMFTRRYEDEIEELRGQARQLDSTADIAEERNPDPDYTSDSRTRANELRSRADELDSKIADAPRPPADGRVTISLRTTSDGSGSGDLRL